jgi:anti-anti-sigma regulatory factor
MLDFDLQRDSGRTHLKFHGVLAGDDDADALRESFAFVAPDDHLILDLGDVDRLDDSVAMGLRDMIAKRTAIAETVVVSTTNRVSMQLVLHDVDRVSPIVPTEQEATAILDGRWANRRHQVKTQ